MPDGMDWKDRQRFEQGITHGIALAMLSAGLRELTIDERQYSLWSYTRRLSIARGADGQATYRIEDRDAR